MGFFIIRFDAYRSDDYLVHTQSFVISMQETRFGRLNSTRIFFVWFLSIYLITASCGPDIPGPVAHEMNLLPDQIDYNFHVKPILSDRCYNCHGPDANKREAGLRLDIADAAFQELVEHPGHFAIRPHSLRSSQLYHRIISSDPEEIMPPPESNLSLTSPEKAILIKWIQDGAEFQSHWAFIKPVRPEVPANHQTFLNPIDAFVSQKLEKRGWQLQAVADQSILLRRVAFDITGLPPEPGLQKKFLRNEISYEHLVDSLLSSPHYGERMAADWMDVSRYADTHGYTVDRYRDMSPWRDWVIQSFNKNMSYDQFVTEQLAGDLLTDATKDQKLATGFNRNHQQNMEGGIVPEEFRVEYVADRTNTFGTAFLGLTFECARCHDHKYDPVSQKEYFQLFSFFNNINEAGQISWDNAMPVPTLLLTDEKTDEIINYIRNEIDSKEQVIEDTYDQSGRAFLEWFNSLEYRSIDEGQLSAHKLAHFRFESNLRNELAPFHSGKMKQQFVPDGLKPSFVSGKDSMGILLDGDAWIDFGDIGRFERSDEFSIGIWVKIPKGLKNGVIFHKGVGAAIYNYRGYHLALKDNRLQLMMAHTFPNNAIIETGPHIPRDEWIHLGMTYDGSGRAKGFQLYINGIRTPTEIEVDNLYKSILFNGAEKEVGLQIGARWRGIGIKDAIVDDVAVFDKELTALEMLHLSHPDDFRKLINQSVNSLSEEEKLQLREYYFSNIILPEETVVAELASARKRLNETTDTLQEVMIMEEMDHPRPTFVLNRGNYNAPGERVYPATPESVLSFSPEYDQNRMGLTQWLFDRQHPLTSRVYVNRLWQLFFGRGIVPTVEDFGNQGQLPSHPELLDWLAIEFMDQDWDIKGMIKLIVTSAAYKQNSSASSEKLEQDPDNDFMSRGPSSRLTAEMMRDNALAASNLLVRKIGGKSVYPYQPDDLWRINGGQYEIAQGEDLYRRSLYTIWKRTVPHPSQATFDAPARSICTVKRQKTSTPLQALVLMNDPIFIEASKVLGEKMSAQADADRGIREAFRLLSGRVIEDKELEILSELYQLELNKFTSSPSKMNGWLESGDYAFDSDADLTMIAANAVIASTIMNTDATMIKR